MSTNVLLQRSSYQLWIKYDLCKIDGSEFLGRGHLIHGQTSMGTLMVVMIDPEIEFVAQGGYGIKERHGGPDRLPLEGTVVTFNLAILFWVIGFIKDETDAIVAAELRQGWTTETVIKAKGTDTEWRGAHQLPDERFGARDVFLLIDVRTPEAGTIINRIKYGHVPRPAKGIASVHLHLNAWFLKRIELGRMFPSLSAGCVSIGAAHEDTPDRGLVQTDAVGIKESLRDGEGAKQGVLIGKCHHKIFNLRMGTVRRRLATWLWSWLLRPEGGYATELVSTLKAQEGLGVHGEETGRLCH